MVMDEEPRIEDNRSLDGLQYISSEGHEDESSSWNTIGGV